MTLRKVHIQTFGCQMNKLDSELVLTLLVESGYIPASSLEEADVVLFNTCSVRKHAEDRVYSRLGSLKALKKKKPGLVLGVIGCMAEKDGGRVFERAPHVDVVCGVRNYADLVGLLRAAESREESRGHRKSLHRLLAVGGQNVPASVADDIQERVHGDISSFQPNLAHGLVYQRRLPACRPLTAQAYLLAMSGCDCRCAYCVVPSLRGRAISRPIADIVREARELAEQGCVEVILLGQNVTAYGSDLGKPGALASLLEAVHAVEGIRRIRFITSHPAYFTDGILDAIGGLPKVCPHIHMPAQSGSDRILARMGRRYTVADYLRIVEGARRRLADVEFASDFIVGFPGETEEDFEQTIALMKEVRFLNSFVFKYSPRPGTRAAEWPDDVPTRVKEERNRRLLEVQREISAEKNAAMVAREVEILVEEIGSRPSCRPIGRTKWNHIVAVDIAAEGEKPGRREKVLPGRFMSVRIARATASTLYGVLE